MIKFTFKSATNKDKDSDIGRMTIQTFQVLCITILVPKTKIAAILATKPLKPQISLK